MSTKKETKGFDLSELESNETATMEVLHPTTMQPLRDDAGEPLTITIAGPESEAFKKVSRKATNRRLKGAKAGRIKVTAEELEAEALELLVACTKDWNGMALDGEVLECNEKNARKVYQRYAWLKNQVDEFINEDSNFLAK